MERNASPPASTPATGTIASLNPTEEALDASHNGSGHLSALASKRMSDGTDNGSFSLLGQFSDNPFFTAVRYPNGAELQAFSTELIMSISIGVWSSWPWRYRCCRP